MKFREVAKGTRAVKVVEFRLANEERPPVSVGVRVLSGAETAVALEKAIAAAKAAGAKEWLDTHPLCRLHEMAQTLAVACVDVDSRDEPFFISADEILQDCRIGADNIAYLFEHWRSWQAECSLDVKDFTPEQCIGILLEEAVRPESARSPLSTMPRGSLESFFHTTAVLFASLLTRKSDSTSPSESDGTSASKSTESGD